MKNSATFAEIPRPNEDPSLAEKTARLILSDLAGQSEPDPEDLRMVLEHMNDRTTVVAMDHDGNVLAAGGLKLEGTKDALIEEVATAAQERGRGLGRGVIRTLEGIAREKGIKTLHVYPTITSEGFYENLGYKDNESEYVKSLLN